ncbi:LOW QUALITY PROTEIN: DNA repair protein complementing XP-G cells-like [Lytechinus variegatus]|uniref:LOW QUALITY PROTEIN: DNA repair protein complementing XP-G cells-like n=1 Tax=Lytechinus variegatus TaxID=7654 RepID=UPI001BB1E24F|nr:LOW QUALITY PROTEIN: DNA repair protein complementing XP-G cells-like [Lytechinus variegatus]
MGVQGLWQLVESTGRPVNLESLEGKVLAVDVSIWLNQAVLGVHGSGITNPHLQVLFNRICKLLFYRIKPIFVFDGAPPQLKKQTLAARRQRKDLAAARTEKTTERLVTNYLKSHAIQAVIEESGEGTSKELPPLHIPRKNETDLFELPPLLSTDLQERNSGSEDGDEDGGISVAMAAHEAEMASTYQDLGEVDIESESFKALPIEVQHELISDIQESSKKNSWARMHQLPKASQDFSQYQVKKLLNKSKLSLRLDDLRKEMRTKMSLSMTALLDAQNESSQVDAGRVASEDTQHYILMRKGNKRDEDSENESDDDIVVASYAERAGFSTSMDLKMAKATRKRGAVTTAATKAASSKDVIEVVLDEDSIPARKKRRDDVIGSEEDKERTRCEDKESKDEALRAELKKFFDQLDAKISPTKVKEQEAGSTVHNLDEEVPFENVFTSTPEISVQPGQEQSCSQPESTKIIKDERTLKIPEIVSDSSAKIDLTLKEERQERIEDEPLELDICGPSGQDRLSQELSKAAKSDRTKEVTEEMHQTIKEKYEMHSGKNRTNPVEELGNTVDLASKTAERTITNPSIAGPGKLIRVADTATTQRQDILKQLQKKKEDMKNMLKAFESRMSDFDIPIVPDDDLAFDDKITPGIDKETDNPLKLSDDTGRTISTCVDRVSLGDEVKESNGSTTVPVPVDGKAVLDVTTSAKPSSGVEVGPKTVLSADADTRAKTASGAGSVQVDVTSAKTASDPGADAGVTAKIGANAEVDKKEELDPGKRVVVEITLDRPLQEIGQKANSDGPVSSDLSFMTRTSLDSEWTSTPYQVDSDDDVQRVYMQESDQEPEIDEWQGLYMDKMNEMEKKLHAERIALEKARRKDQKKSYSITDTMYAESKEMLRCFGIPYIESPQEAEAQCAFLDLTNQTEGTITDDSDIWLFGGQRVFRHFFSKKKDPEYFKVGDIERHLLLDRKKLINLAYLVGSDYTLGIQGIGSVGAIEIMGEFKGQGIKTLKDFKSWWTRSQNRVLPSGMNAVRSKWCKLVLPDEFPNPLIAKAYMNPVIDESDEGFQWGSPDLGLLREYARERFGWMRTKVDENLLPVLKRLNEKQVQSKMTSFFGIVHHGNRKKIASKRMRNALMQMERSSSEEDEEESESEEEEERRPKKRKKVSSEAGKKRVKRKKKPAQGAQQGGMGEVQQKVKKRVKRKKKVALNQEDEEPMQELNQGSVQTKNAPKSPVSEKEKVLSKKSRVQNGKTAETNSNGREKRQVPQVDYAAMMDDYDEDIPDEVLLDVAEDMEMAALMDEPRSGHNVTYDLRNISNSSSSQPKSGSHNSSLDRDFVEERRGKGRGGAVPKIGGGTQRGKGKRGGANKGKALLKRRPVQMNGPNLSSSGSDSD